MPFFENILRKTKAKFDIIAPIKPECRKKNTLLLETRKQVKCFLRSCVQEVRFANFLGATQASSL